MNGTAAVLINNALARLSARRIYLVGLSIDQKSYLSFVPNSIRIDIDSLEDAYREFDHIHNSLVEDLPCRTGDIAQALFRAKSNRQRLNIQENAPELTKNALDGGQGLIVAERENDIADLIATNYAYAVGADLVFVDPVPRHEVHELQKHIHEWKRQKSLEAHAVLSKLVHDRVSHIPLSKYEYVTFFTEGLPYGTMLQNVRPFSHVFRGVSPDLFVFNNILREVKEDVAAFGSALVFCPEPADLGMVARRESQEAIQSLESNNMLVKPLLRERATVGNLDAYGVYYPYDLLHICSHGGETDGYYVIQEFTDRAGQKHTIEYEEVVGFSPSGNDMVKVFRKALFKRLDGFRWMSPELTAQQLPSYVYEDIMMRLRDEKNVQRINANYPIYGSCHVQCADSIHQGQFHALAAFSWPIVLNNTCSSWKDIAAELISVGCRGYIGTVWPVNNTTALDASRAFYQGLFSENLIDACFAMNQSVKAGKDQHIYLYWGLHFAKLSKPRTLNKKPAINALLACLYLWQNDNGPGKSLASTEKTRSEAGNIIRRILAQDFTEADLAEFMDDATERSATNSELERFTDKGVFDMNP